jgi:FixJ family two-component response regulator
MVTNPAEPEKTQPNDTKGSVTRGPQLDALTIVSIVDDDVVVGEATKDLLRSHGYSAAAFVSAEDFLSSGRIGETSCLITDVRMPGMSGFELQQQLIADGYDIPIIFMTALPEESVQEEALVAGAYGFLKKPYQEQYLISCVEAALRLFDKSH